MYDGLPVNHNYAIGGKLKGEGEYLKAMQELQKELIEEFAKLDSPYIDEKSLGTDVEVKEKE